jgi:hypothetical protein
VDHGSADVTAADRDVGEGEWRTARGSRHWIVLAAVVVALCVVAVVAVGRDRRPVDIAVLDPPAASLGELL